MQLGLIEREWQGFEGRVMPPEASVAQRKNMRIAFFAGATSMFNMLIRNVSQGEEITQTDMELMDSIEGEIAAFADNMRPPA